MTTPSKSTKNKPIKTVDEKPPSNPSTRGFKFADDFIKRFGAYGLWFWVAYISLTTFALIAWVIDIIFASQALGLSVYRGFFMPNTETCEWGYSLSFIVWAYGLFIAVNLLDFIFGFQASQKYWGVPTAIITWGATVLNILTLFALWIVYDYIIPINNPEYSLLQNPGSSKYAFGRPEFIASPASESTYYNPEGYPLYPQVQKLSRYEYWDLHLYCSLTIVILGVLRCFLVTGIPSVQDGIRKAFEVTKNVYDNVSGSGFVKGVTKTIEDIKSVPVKNGAVISDAKVSFFHGWSDKLRVAFISVFTLGQLLYLILFAVWAVVFHVRGQTIKYKYVNDVVGVTNVVRVQDATNSEMFALYTLIGLNIFPLIFNLFLGNRTFKGLLHRVGMVSAAFGSAINSVLAIWLIVMASNTNVPGFPNNVFHDKRTYCQDPFTNTENGCENRYACPTLAPSAGASGEGIFLCVVVGWALLTNILHIVVGVFVDKVIHTLPYQKTPVAENNDKESKSSKNDVFGSFGIPEDGASSEEESDTFVKLYSAPKQKTTTKK